MGSYQGKVYNTPEEAEEYVKSTIEAHPVVLFTKRFSPFCYKATSSFKGINVAYEEVLLSGRPDCQIIQDVLLKMTGARTVPRVFIHQKCIGGGNETSALYKENKLKDLVDGKESSTKIDDVEAPKNEESISNAAAEETLDATAQKEKTDEDQKPDPEVKEQAVEEAVAKQNEQMDEACATEEQTEEISAEQPQTEQVIAESSQGGQAVVSEELAIENDVQDAVAPETETKKEEETSAEKEEQAEDKGAGDAPEESKDE